MNRGTRHALLLIFIFTWVLAISVPGSYAQFSGPAPGLRSDAFTRMSPLLPYSPFTESFSAFAFDPFISPLFSDPFSLLFFGPLSSAISLPSPFLPPYLSPTLAAASTALNPVAPPSLSAAAGIPMRTAAQTGTWSGTWTSNYIAFIVLWHTGPMTLNIVVDPVTGAVAGTGTLQGSRYASILFNVTGVEANSAITISGFLGTGYNIYIDGILSSPTTVTGTWKVVGTAGGTILDYGVFSVTLV